MFDFKLTPDGADPFEVTAGSRDVLVWERTGKAKSMARLLADPNLVDLYRLAHIACRRLGLFNGDLQEFEQTVELDTQDRDEEDEGRGPTRPAP